jgi:hypothetical protein
MPSITIKSLLLAENGRRCKTIKVMMRVCADCNKKIENVVSEIKKPGLVGLCRAWSALHNGIAVWCSASGYVGYWWGYVRL